MAAGHGPVGLGNYHRFGPSAHGRGNFTGAGWVVYRPPALLLIGSGLPLPERSTGVRCRDRTAAAWPLDVPSPFVRVHPSHQARPIEYTETNHAWIARRTQQQRQDSGANRADGGGCGVGGLFTAADDHLGTWVWARRRWKLIQVLPNSDFHIQTLTIPISTLWNGRGTETNPRQESKEGIELRCLRLRRKKVKSTRTGRMGLLRVGDGEKNDRTVVRVGKAFAQRSGIPVTSRAPDRRRSIPEGMGTVSSFIRASGRGGTRGASVGVNQSGRPAAHRHRRPQVTGNPGSVDRRRCR